MNLFRCATKHLLILFVEWCMYWIDRFNCWLANAANKELAKVSDSNEFDAARQALKESWDKSKTARDELDRQLQLLKDWEP